MGEEIRNFDERGEWRREIGVGDTIFFLEERGSETDGETV